MTTSYYADQRDRQTTKPRATDYFGPLSPESNQSKKINLNKRQHKLPSKKYIYNVNKSTHNKSSRGVLPTLTPNEYLQASKLSTKRNMK